MKTTFYVICVIIALLFLADTTIKFNPFNINFGKIYFAIGFIFILIGIAFIELQGKVIGRNDVRRVVIEVNKEEKVQRQDKCPSCGLIHPLVREFGLCGKCAEEQY